MYKLYFENKTVIFCSDCSDSTGWVIKPDDDGSVKFTKVLQNLEKNNKICILSDDPQAVFEQFCTQLETLEAGGGLVRNNHGQYLMIRRNGRWDLPKGHIEEGESMEECALREVEEETGLHNLVSKGLVVVTNHAYPYNGVWMLKKCWWYAMEYSGNETLVPQLEEGIEEARWFAESDLAEAIKTTYFTIRQVFDSANIKY